MIVCKIFIFTFASSILAQCDKGVLLGSGGSALERSLGQRPLLPLKNRCLVCCGLRVNVFRAETASCPWVSSHAVFLGLTYTVAVSNTWRAEAKLNGNTPDICQGHASSVPLAGSV